MLEGTSCNEYNLRPLINAKRSDRKVSYDEKTGNTIVVLYDMYGNLSAKLTFNKQEQLLEDVRYYEGMIKRKEIFQYDNNHNLLMFTRPNAGGLFGYQLEWEYFNFDGMGNWTKCCRHIHYVENGPREETELYTRLIEYY